MAKIKIRSAKNILYAYLSNFGNVSDELIDNFIKAYPHIEKSENIIKEIDNILYKVASKLLNTKLSKLQTLSLFKSIIIENRLLDKYGMDIFIPNKNLDFIKDVKDNSFEIVPQYKMSQMPIQEIVLPKLRK